MEKCLGRSDDMLIIRGVNVFPSQIESILLEMGETEPHYRLVVDRENNLDILEVQVEVGDQFFSDEIKKLEQLTAKIRRNIESTLGISVKVKLVEPKTFERYEGKTCGLSIDGNWIKFFIRGKKMIIKQLSVFLENKAGRLTELTGILGRAGINMTALSIADTSEFGIIRTVVSDPEKALQILKEHNFSVSLTDGSA